LTLAHETPRLDELAEIITAPWRTPEGAALLGLVPPTLELLSWGEPVSPEQIAAAAGRSPEQVRAALHRRSGVDWDERGRVAGLGLALRPTPHRIELGGRALFGWCALDTLVFPVLLGRPARSESPCRGTGEPVRAEATPAEVEAASQWLAQHPGARLLPVGEAFRLGRLIADGTFGAPGRLVPSADEPAAEPTDVGGQR
jgi:alkylmercury lyase